MADKQEKKPEVQATNMSNVTDEALTEELQRRKSKNRWIGKGGLWSTFRNIGKTFYQDKSLSTDEKKAKLVQEIKAFVDERLA